MIEDYQNLCTYHHPKMKCTGAASKELRHKCKFFPKTLSECPDFDTHGCEDCNCISAHWEFWFINEKPE